MTKQEIRARIEELGIIPAVRCTSAEDARFAAEAVADAGISIVEIAITSPLIVQVISDLAKNNPELVVGAEVIADVDAAQRLLDAGVKFLTGPGLDLKIVEFAVKKDVVVLPGALSPTEVMLAWAAGSDFVKIFPCSHVGGDQYIRALKGPFSKVPLIASGGVNQVNAAGYLKAGAVALGIGGELIPRDAIARRHKEHIRELARRFLKFVRDARGG